MPKATSCRRPIRRGSVLAQMVLCVTVLLGVLAVCLDGGVLLAERQHAQATADAAAMAAAADLFKNWNTYGGVDTPGTAAKSAKTIAAANGYSTAPTVHIPPTSGNHVGVNGYVEVTVTYSQGRYFSQLWSKNNITVSARAVARGMLSVGTANPNNNVGFLILGTGSGVVSMNGNTSIDLDGTATFAVNSTNSPFSAKNGTITAGNFVFRAANQNSLGNAPTFLPGNASKTYGTQTSDPLSSLVAPSTTGLSAQSYTGQSTIDPGIYTGPLSIGNNSVTMNPGIYYLKPNASGNAGISIGPGLLDGSSGVFIYVAPGTGSMDISVSGNGSMVLNPINTGTYRGISIYVDRTWANAKTSMDLGGNTNGAIYGTLYAPTVSTTLHGTPGFNTASQIIINDITLKGSASAGVGKGPKAGQSIGFQLVE